MTENVHALLTSVTARRYARRQFKERLAPTHAIDFNPLTIYKLDEMRLSAILAFLLNPKSSHGQDELFLREFCALMVTDADENLSYPLIDATNLELANAQVKTEHVVQNGRIDILIEIPQVGRDQGPAFALVIENKFGAAENDTQLQAYTDFARKKYGHTEAEWILIYLTPEGDKPFGASDEVTNLSYREHVQTWLHESKTLIEAQTVRDFVGHLQDYLQRRLYGGLTKMEQRDLANEIAGKDSEHVRSAFEVERTIRELKRKLARNLHDQIENELATRLPMWQSHTTDDRKPDQRYFGYEFSKRTWKNLTVLFQFQTPDYKDFYIGLRWSGKGQMTEQRKSMDKSQADTELPGAAAVADELADLGNFATMHNDTFFKFSSTQRIPGSWQEPQDWERVHDGTMAQAIVELLADIDNRVEGVVQQKGIAL